MKKTQCLAFKLIASILTFSFLSVGLLMLHRYQTTKKIIIGMAETNAQNITNSTVNQIDALLQSIQAVPANMAIVLSRQKYTENELIELLQEMVKSNPYIYGSCIAYEPFAFSLEKKNFAPFVHRDGKDLKTVYLDRNGYDYRLWDWYQVPQVLEQSLWSEPYFDEGGGNIIMTSYSVPFYHEAASGKKLAGVLTVDISLHWLQQQVKDLRVYERGYAYLVSRNGTIITHPNPHLIMNESIFSIAEEFHLPMLRKTGRKMVQGDSGFFKTNSFHLGIDSYIYYAPIPSSKWALGLIIPEKEMLADLHEITKISIGFSIVLFLLLFWIVAFFSKKITRPLTRLAFITEEIGSGNFDMAIPITHSKDEIGQLSLSFIHMQEALKEYTQTLKETTAAKEKFESELRIAHEIQMSIIPNIFPPFPERTEFDLFAILHPARQVGGDLYDFFFIDDHHLCFAIGDVSGKGVPASLFMAVTRTMLRAKASIDLEVHQIVDAINKDLCKDNDMCLFVTFFIGIIDLRTGKIKYCNAGHNPTYIYQGDQLSALEEVHGFPLGVESDQEYGSNTLTLKENEFIFLYTDGISEAMNPAFEEFGNQRLEDSLKRNASKEPLTMVQQVEKEVKSFAGEAEQSDDITMLCLKFNRKMS